MFKRVVHAAIAQFLWLIALLGLMEQPVNASSELDGRLGGSVESFVSAYGEPLPDEGGSGYLFGMGDGGQLRVQFNRTGGEPRPDDPALLITASAPRPAEWPALEPHAADWSIDDAQIIVASLLPADAVVEKGSGLEDGRTMLPCRSEALEARFGVLTLGQCSATLIQPTGETVSYVTVSMTGAVLSGTEGDGEAPACDGVVAWSQATSARLSEAQAILGAVSALDPESDATVAELQRLATALGDLAAAQRSEPAPAAAATANYYVIAALAGYATAVELAANGTAAGDQSTIDEAVTEVSRANDAVNTAVEEIEAAVDDCGLAIDPAATPTGAP